VLRPGRPRARRRGVAEAATREDYLPRPGRVRTTCPLKQNRKRPSRSLSQNFVSRPKFRLPLEVSSRARSSYLYPSRLYFLFCYARETRRGIMRGDWRTRRRHHHPDQIRGLRRRVGREEGGWTRGEGHAPPRPPPGETSRGRGRGLVGDGQSDWFPCEVILCIVILCTWKGGVRFMIWWDLDACDLTGGASYIANR
jgi:hypothetical protein